MCTAHDKKSGAHKLRYIADLEEEWLNDLDKGGARARTEAARAEEPHAVASGDGGDARCR